MNSNPSVATVDASPVRGGGKPEGGEHRPDIQALRGVAIILVLLYHARLPPFTAGFLGVDLFFVLSGYLITGLVVRSLLASSFSFRTFYIRRAFRLLPAAYVVIGLCLALGPFLLVGVELHEFFAQAFGAVSFTSNMVLWEQAGYFGVDASLKPLLHFWSLSIEEQYYLLLPAALVFLPRNWWRGTAVVILMASLVLCVQLAASDPDAAFYFLPTRAWELALGSVIALGGRAATFGKKWAGWLAPLSLAAILYVCARPLGKAHPGMDALVVCAATGCLIQWPGKLLAGAWVQSSLGRVGDMSYSLYLVHWPLFVALGTLDVSGGGVPWPLRVLVLVVSLVLGALLYSRVEKRFRITRSTEVTRTGITVLAGSSIALLLIAAWGFQVTRHHAADEGRLRGVVGLDWSCNDSSSLATNLRCQSKPNPDTLIWGDSFAMHLVPGLQEESELAFLQATRNMCPPVPDIAPGGTATFNEARAKDCVRFNEGVLRMVLQTPALTTVILASSWTDVVDGRTYEKYAAELRERDASEQDVVNRINALVETLRKAGKRVVIVEPPPAPGFDAGRCGIRLLEGLPFVGAAKDCSFSRKESEKVQAGVRRMLAEVGRRSDTDVISFWDALCLGDKCQTTIDGAPIYRDAGHLSHEGSKVIGKKLGLQQQIRTRSR